MYIVYVCKYMHVYMYMHITVYLSRFFQDTNFHTFRQVTTKEIDRRTDFVSEFFSAIFIAFSS